MEEEIFEDYLRSTAVCGCNDHIFNKDNSREANDRLAAIDAVLIQYRILVDLVSYGALDVSKEILQHWAITTVSTDLFALATGLKETIAYFQVYDNTCRSVSLDGFKHYLSSIPGNMVDFVRPIENVVESFLRRPTPIDFSVINQHFCFLTRLSLRSVDYSDVTIQGYLDLEEKLRKNVISDRTMEELNTIVKEWFSGFSLERPLPAHGSGAVAFMGRASLYEKYSNLRYDRRLEYYLKDFPDWKNPLLRSVRAEEFPFRVAQLALVPKSITANRTICCENVTLQYFQKGIASQLQSFCHTSYISPAKALGLRDEHGYLRDISALNSHVNFQNQDINREWARLGSKDNSYATIDLSNASDSVSLRLAKRMFKGTKLLRYIITTRSDEFMLPDGTCHVFQKLYPSGAALCFPIELIIFLAVCELAVRRSTVPRTQDEYRAFGDDIIIRPRFVGQLIDILAECGFTTNTSKSFIFGPFRESCGGEYYRGWDVSPLRISRKFRSIDEFSCLESFDNRRKLANELAKREYQTARTFVIRDILSLSEKLMKNKRRKLYPLFTDTDKYLYSPTPTNFKLENYYNDDLHCTSYRYGSVGTVAGSLSSTPASRKEYLIYKEKTRNYYVKVRQLQTKGYFIPDPDNGRPNEPMPNDYENIRYQNWIDSSAREAVLNLAFLKANCDLSSVRTRTKTFLGSVYHDS